jgi:segregation and condensation protein B
MNEPEHDAPQDAVAEAEIAVDESILVPLEALLMSTDRALTEARLGALLTLEGKGVAKRVHAAIDTLNGQYEQAGRSFRIERLAGGWQILTTPEHHDLISRLHEERRQSRLSQAALETLAIIAYRQPMLRAEVEAIRGVACGEVLRGLLDRRLVKIVGRAEVLGRPMLYGTTREFLQVFGLSSLDDLPEIDGLKETSLKPLKAEPESREEAPATPEGEDSKDEDADASEPPLVVVDIDAEPAPPAE